MEHDPELLERLKTHVHQELQKTPIKALVEAKKGHERNFTNDFLYPCIRDFFCKVVREEFHLTAEQIENGLGAEGYEGLEGFGYTPAGTRKHLFTKTLVTKSSAPKAWRVSSPGLLTSLQAYPDFAIRHPLPLSVVGEAKYFKSNSPEAAIKELYDAARQVVFYLGAFPGMYQAALIVIGDASGDQSFAKARGLLKPELFDRFGAETNIHVVTIPVA